MTTLTGFQLPEPLAPWHRGVVDEVLGVEGRSDLWFVEVGHRTIDLRRHHRRSAAAAADRCAGPRA